ncbi:MAG TPA: hypothetical protein VM118_04525 [Acidobacteriota bacterium]|nr:hypothetical protein [Acidobacteriota bacterium]
MDRIWRVVWRVAAILTLAAVGLALGCTSRRSVDPGPVKYNIYIGATKFSVRPNQHLLYIYNADSFQLVDSISLESFVFDMEVSPDGRWLYTVRGSQGPDVPRGLTQRDSRTGEVGWFHGADELMVTMHKDGVLLVHGHDVLRARDGNVLLTLPDSIIPGWGPLSATQVAATVTTSGPISQRPPVVSVLDLESGKVSGRYEPHLSNGALLHTEFARLHPDGRRVLVIAYRERIDQTWFVVGDVLTGETLLQYPLIYPLGEVAISEDGLLAVVTDPSAPLIFNSRPTLDVFDLDQMVHLQRIVLPIGEFFIPSQVLFLPGDKTVITAPRADLVYTGPLNVIDLTSVTIERSFWLPPGDAAFTGALGLVPQF